MLLRERWFATREVELNFAEGPVNGAPFVLLHGGAARWQYGLTLLESMASEWHVYAPDLRGHGQSGHVRGAYGVADYVRDIAAFIEVAVGEPAVVFGHSLGGEVGVMLAARHPRLVRALIVGDAPLSANNPATEEPYHRKQNELWAKLAGRPAAEIRAALRAMPVLEPGATEPRPAREVMGEDSDWFATQAATLEQLDPGVLEAVLFEREQMLSGYDPYVLLPAIVCPVLLLQADPMEPMMGGVMRDDDVELGLRQLSRGTHVRLDGIGHPLHGPPWQTERVVQAITAFLSRSVDSAAELGRAQ